MKESSQYIKNSINAIKEYAKSHRYKIEFTSTKVDFHFIVYKPKFFGLYNKFIKKFYGSWDGIEYNFDNVWESVKNFINYLYYNEIKN